MNDSPKTFENSAIRTIWNEQEEEWYFSVVDVVGVLTEQASPRTASTYWAVLKKRLTEEGAEQLLTNCKQLKMKSTDGKMRLTDVANTEQLLRIIQSIPSKKAEPFKLWLAEVGKERIEETIDPEQTIDRALATYAKKTDIPDISNLALKDDIPSVEGLASKDWVLSQNYLTKHQSLSNYAKKTDLPDTSNFVTRDEIP